VIAEAIAATYRVRQERVACTGTEPLPPPLPAGAAGAPAPEAEAVEADLRAKSSVPSRRQGPAP
jgi:hypothetical protein